MIVKALETVSTIMIIICIGYLISELGWYKKENKDFLTKIIINLAVPSIIIKTFFVTFPREVLVSSGNLLILTTIAVVLPYLISLVLVRRFDFPKMRREAFLALGCMSNAMFIGMPVNLSIFGEKAIPYVMIYFLVANIFLWVYFAPKFKDEKEGQSKIKSRLEGLLSAPLIVMFASIILSILNFKLPAVVLNTVDFLGGMSTPLSLLFIGGVIHEVGLKNIRFDISTAYIVLIKFIISPLVMFVLLRYFKVDPLASQVLTIQAGMPSMTQLGVIAASSKDMSLEDNEYVMVNIASMTLISLIFIPIYMSLMPKFL